MRQISRTPSPTPSEAAELQKKGIFDWKAMKNWRYWFRKEWFCAFAVTLLPLWFLLKYFTFTTGYYVIGIILVVLFTLMTIYHEQIIDWLKPRTDWMRT